MKKLTIKMISFLLLMGAPIFFTGCNDNDVEDAADEMGDALEEGADNVGDAVDDATN